jgi:two-component system nitrogen regulation response regulator GlnG
LFGHEKGAFTGAISAKQGKFEMAEGGTLFLDEISNMPLGSQIKMLRAIQEKSFFRVGGTKPVKVDVRFIVATNDNLNISVKKSKFSRDLFYRLGEFSIHIPPLSTRREDIIYIAEKIIATTNEELGKTVIGISDSAKTLLLNHLWPGNVRQLRSVIRRAVLAADDRILPQHIIFQEEVPGNDSSPIETNGDHPDGLSLREIVRRNTMYLERKIIIETLKKTAGNKAKAARILQIDYTTIHAKIKQYGISSDLGYLNDGDE